MAIEMKSIRKAISYLFCGEFARLVKALEERIPRWLFWRWRGYVLEFHNDLHASEVEHWPGLPTGYSLGMAQRSDLSAVAEVSRRRLVECERRFAAGDLCYAVFFDGRPVSVLWTHQGSCHIRALGLLLEIGQSESYVYEGATDVAHSRRGLFKANLAALRCALRCEKRRCFALVMEGNHVPLRVLSELGFEVTQVVRHVALLTLKITFLSDMEGRTRSRQVRWNEPAGVFGI